MSNKLHFHFVRLSPSQIHSTVIMSILAPLLAGMIQTAWVLTHSIPSRYYTAVFYQFGYEGIGKIPSWIILLDTAIKALITFFIVCGSIKIAASLRWPAFLICCAFWVYVAFISVGVVS